jgi:hypothetical protein
MDGQPVIFTAPSPYLPISKNSRQLRFCRIVQEYNDIVSCTLEPADLDGNVPYECLSYCWGEARTKWISINGCRYPAQDSLNEALLLLRSLKLAKPLWIDAICVNQDDMDEKRHQVPMMAKIFEQAERVYMWLGPNLCSSQGNQTADVNPSVRSIKEAKSFFRQLAKDVHFHDLSYFTRSNSTWVEDSELNKASWSDLMGSLSLVMDADWFTRMWIVQEAVLAKRATLMFGEESIEFDTVRDAWKNWNEHYKTCCRDSIPRLSGSDFKRLYKWAGMVLDFDKAQHSLNNDRDLFMSLLRFKSRTCRDPKDKIWGLMGLQRGPSRIVIDPDYSLDPVAAYTDFARRLIEARQWLVPLHLDLSHTDAHEKLPSWVPDWWHDSDEPADYTARRFAALNLYEASANLPRKRLIPPKEDTLHVTGLPIDTIKSCASECSRQRSGWEQLAIVGRWQQWVFRCLMKMWCSRTTIQTAFDRTLLADAFIGGNGVPKKPFQADMDKWRQYLNTNLELLSHGHSGALPPDPYMASHVIACNGRKLFISANGRLGLCPARAEPGDKISLLSHCCAPIILRQSTQSANVSNRYTAIGHAYVDGIMQGEGFTSKMRLSSIVIE